ncbi:Hint domain-containing protein [Loktanella sp. IMCC34160]|uniref:Hint domain-containing protein n=1 Tax=Loktanella sp. IMCC34160 TaxID=2510646 RepID=UPI0013EDF5FD|nr:Hint domain-containing protein [Loktanella sp. IMCC34160]
MARFTGTSAVAPSEGQFVLNGYNILNNASVKGNPNGGYLNEGQTTVSGGEMVFEPDDIIVITAINLSPTGAITADSEITSIVVYDSVADYLSGTVKYSYTSDSSGSVVIDNATADLGDTYLGFNANTLTSDDPTAPDLGQLFIAAGEDLTDVAAGLETLTIDQFSDIDYNESGLIDGGTEEPADGQFSGENNLLAVICVARGTLIDTADGPRYVETLTEGDLVLTLDAGAQPIRWIGSRKVDASGMNAPIRFRAGSIGNYRDLYVSPNHRMLVFGTQAELLYGTEEVLVAAKHLVDDARVTRAPRAEIEYFHFLFDRHQIVFAEGAPTESLFPARYALNAVEEEAREEIIRLFPELEEVEAVGELSRPEITGREARALFVA